VTTLIARRAQQHQSYLAANPSSTGRYYQAQLAGISQALIHKGLSTADATRRATATLYGQLVRQATTLAYLDVLRMFAVMAAIMVPLLVFAKAPKPGKAAMGH
jgi:DHA2 family multidrug resistance protein